MNKKIYLILGIIVTFFIVVGISNNSFAKEQTLRNLEYKAVLNDDGTADVTEIWDIYVEDTNTLFKTFEIDNKKYSAIEDVSVTEITNGMNKRFEQIYEEKYHVDKDCFYALINSDYKFEIAWGVHEDDSNARRTFSIKYKIVDAIKNYNDCSEFYWQFVGKDNAIEVDKLYGTIILPMDVVDIDDLRVWAHGPLNGNIEKKSTSIVTFDVEDLSEEKMVETRVVTPTYVFENNQNRYQTDKLDSIFEEEAEWARKANIERTIDKIIWIGIFTIALIISIILVVLCVKYIIEGKNLKEKYKNKKSDLKYFRDIPNEEYATPARSAFMFYYNNSSNGAKLHIPQIFSATILDFALKGIISFEQIEEKNDKDFYIILNKNKEFDLTRDEKAVYEILEKAIKNGDRITTKELKKYSKKEYEKVYSKLKDMCTYAEKHYEECGYIDKDKKKLHSKWDTKAAVYLVLLFISLLFIAIMPTIILCILPLFACTIICSRNSGYIDTLSQIGEDEREKWIGLKKYMNDFSLLKDKEVPDLILWEKYLVYATAFGISEKVIKQLQVVYKEFNDPDYFANNHYAYMYYMSRTHFGNNFISNLNTTMTSVCTAATSSYSSAHGGGGGFSGGGGGRRWRRPEWADVKPTVYVIFILYKHILYIVCNI